MKTVLFYLSMPAVVKTVRFDTRVTVVTCSNGMHGLVVAASGDRVDAIAGLESLRAVGFRVAGIAGVF